ncbi:MAG: hypothetical protein U5K69_06530 [Balneolaceae bacterium]|nr:hypothetical protein [Balneolaceae bacterium]
MAVSLLLSCSEVEQPVVCTEEFRIYDVTVLSPDGTPASDFQIEVRDPDNGDLYEICEGVNDCNWTQPGTYVIMHDGFLGKISEEKETIAVTGTKENMIFEQEFEFRSGECHVEKIAGPDTVSLVSN